MQPVKETTAYGLGDIKVEVFKALNGRGIDVWQSFVFYDNLTEQILHLD